MLTCNVQGMLQSGAKKLYNFSTLVSGADKPKLIVCSGLQAGLFFRKVLPVAFRHMPEV